MKNEEFRNSKIIARSVDFIVLGLTFYFTCSILSIHAGSNILLLTVVYSGVILLSVRLGKHLLSRVFSPLSTVLKLMLNNAAGLLIGVCIMLILGFIIPGFSEFSVAIIIASIMAFFILGTLSPLIRFDKHTHP